MTGREPDLQQTDAADVTPEQDSKRGSGAPSGSSDPVLDLSEGDSASPEPTPDLASVHLERLQRLQAEFDNYRRRTLREQEEWSRRAQAEVIRELLPGLDDLRRARDHAAATGGTVDATGLLLVLKRWEDALLHKGLEEFVAERGEPFDVERHEAVLSAPSEEVVDGHVLDTLDPGYEWRQRLLRPARVRVSSGTPDS